jgi:hypothetical protein
MRMATAAFRISVFLVVLLLPGSAFAADAGSPPRARSRARPSPRREECDRIQREIVPRRRRRLIGRHQCARAPDALAGITTAGAWSEKRIKDEDAGSSISSSARRQLRG